MTDWDDCYDNGEHGSDDPHPVITRFAAKFVAGRALDLACGPGRHSLWLAERGWQVRAVDNSRVAIQMLEKRARERNVRIESLVADLEQHEFVIESESYDLIVVCN